MCLLQKSLKYKFWSSFYFDAADLSFKLIRKKESYKWSVYDTLNRNQSQWSKVEDPEIKDGKDASSSPKIAQEINQTEPDLGVNKYGSDDENGTSNKWKLELDWLSKALEPALQMWRWPLPTGLF